MVPRPGGIRMIVARLFIAWNRFNRESVPEGTV
jgi:hypothetical protein